MWKGIFYPAALLFFIQGNLFALEGKNPARILSTSLASDEILVEILEEAKSLNRLLALSTLADNPQFSNISGEEASKVKLRVGTSLEQVVALRPDFVFLAGFNREAFIHQIEGAKIPFFIVEDFTSLEAIGRHILEIGEKIGERKAAQVVFDRYQEGLNKARKEASSKKPLSALFIQEDYRSMGKDTIIDSIFSLLGIKNLVSAEGITGWPQLSQEKLLLLQPDLLVTVGEPTEEGRKAKLQMFASLPGFQKMEAVKKGKIVVVKGRELFATSQHVLGVFKYF